MSLSDMQRNVAHVVHLMLENRGFDHVLGWLWNETGDPPRFHAPSLRSGEHVFYGVPQDAAGNPTVWLPDDASYFGSGPYTGGRKFIHRGSWGYCNMPPADPGEVWDDVTQQIYGPAEDLCLPPEKQMKGFYLNYLKARLGIGSTDDILATFTPAELPVLSALARSYAVSDMWFSSAPTQTNPNRAFSVAGSSLNRLNNHGFWGEPFHGLRTLFGVFGDSGVPWKLYSDYTWQDGKYFTQYMFPDGMASGSFGSIADFAADVAGDRLPAFSYLEPTFLGERWLEFSSYHPPGSTYQGEKFLKTVFESLTANPAVWRKALLIVTFDEHGGTYDHLTPPTNAIPPDSLDPPSPFSRFGVRVPTLLVSPWVPPGTVFRADYYPEGGPASGFPYDHTSVLATLCKWKNVPYQSPGDPGWLRRRTARAPTFEDVITNLENGVLPRLDLFECRLFDARGGEMVGTSGVPAGRVRQIVRRITGGDHAAELEDEILATAKTLEDLERAFDRIAGI